MGDKKQDSLDPYLPAVTTCWRAHHYIADDWCLDISFNQQMMSRLKPTHVASLFRVSFNPFHHCILYTLSFHLHLNVTVNILTLFLQEKSLLINFKYLSKNYETLILKLQKKIPLTKSVGCKVLTKKTKLLKSTLTPKYGTWWLLKHSVTCTYLPTCVWVLFPSWPPPLSVSWPPSPPVVSVSGHRSPSPESTAQDSITRTSSVTSPETTLRNITNNRPNGSASYLDPLVSNYRQLNTFLLPFELRVKQFL